MLTTEPDRMPGSVRRRLLITTLVLLRQGRLLGQGHHRGQAHTTPNAHHRTPALPGTTHAAISLKVPSGTGLIRTSTISVLPVQKALSSFTRRTDSYTIHGFKLNFRGDVAATYPCVGGSDFGGPAGEGP